MARNVFSAGVYPNIVDDSFIVDGEAPMSAGIVIESLKGPVEVTNIRSANEFVSKYGLPDRDHPSMYAAMRLLRVGQSLSVYRVAGDASEASGELIDGVDTKATFTAANPGAWANGIEIQFADVIGLPAGSTIFAVLVFDADGEQLERFEVSRDESAIDGFGRNVFIEDVINERSLYIRVDDDPSVTGPYDTQTTVTLAGGSDATTAIASTEVVTAWDEFVNDRDVDADILINAGWTSADVQNKMVDVAEGRENCRAILEVPEDTADDVSLMVDWRDNELAVDTPYASLYGGWLRVLDQYNNREVMVPPSGDVAAATVRVFQTGRPWEAVAGLQRGNLDARGTSKIYSRDEMDELYLNGINPITSIAGLNAVIWGQKSLQRQASAMDRNNVVNNVLWMTSRMKSYLEPFVFGPNTQFERDNANYVLTQFLTGIQNQGGLYAFRVDTESSNTPAVIDQNEFIVDVYVQPTRTAEFVRLNLTVTPTGVDLEAL